MDSSRSDHEALEGFSPWQVGRLRDRLMNYKAAKRQGWERIATDILYVEDLPESYLDTEEVRPLSESLRRLVNGSQIPNDQRLDAVRLFLLAQGYLAQHDLDQDSSSSHAPMAFADFMKSAWSQSEQWLQKQTVFEGTFTHIHDGGLDFVEQRLDLVFEGNFFGVSYRRAFLKKIDSVERVTTLPSVRKRALWREDKYEGWAVCGPFGQIMVIVRASDYENPPKIFLLWAVEERDDENVPVSDFLLVPYDRLHNVADLDVMRKALVEGCDMESEPSGFYMVKPDFELFTRTKGG